MRCLRFGNGLLPLAAAFLLVHCGRTGKVGAGTYAVADQEYSSQNYRMERELGPEGSFAERHVVDQCLLLELSGTWNQDGDRLKLSYARSRSRRNCRDSLPAWSVDTSRLEIPVRNVEKAGYEALLAAAGGRPEKWIRWLRTQ